MIEGIEGFEGSLGLLSQSRERGTVDELGNAARQVSAHTAPRTTRDHGTRGRVGLTSPSTVLLPRSRPERRDISPARLGAQLLNYVTTLLQPHSRTGTKAVWIQTEPAGEVCRWANSAVAGARRDPHARRHHQALRCCMSAPRAGTRAPRAGTRAEARGGATRQRRSGAGPGLPVAAGTEGMAKRAERGGRTDRGSGKRASAVVLAVFVVAISRTNGHKKYPELEYVTKEVDEFSTQDEIDQQAQDLPLTPLKQRPEIFFTAMLAANGFGRAYPNNALHQTQYSSPDVSPSLNWFKVVSGGFHTCAIRRYFNKSKHLGLYDEFDHQSPDDAPGQLRCWGMNDYGQVYPMPLPFGEPQTEDTADDFGGMGPACTKNSESPKIIARTEVNAGVPGKDFSVVQLDCWDLDDGWRNLSAGWLHTCGILANGTMFCWGNNDHGEMGSAAEPKVLLDGEPRCASEDAMSHTCQATFAGKWALTEFGGVSAGKRQTCAIKCVDDNAADYADPYATTKQKWPEFPPASCVQGRVVCWGDSRLGQGARGLKALQNGRVAAFDDFISVCAGAAHSCAVRKGGQLYCWGHDGNNRATVPQRLINKKWRGVKCRGASTCAITVANAINRSALYCWGHNGHQQSIVPSFAKQSNVPIEGSQVPLIRREIYARSIDVFDTGDLHTCAIWQTTDDEQDCDIARSKPPALNGECWGENSYGQSNFLMDTAGRPYGWKEEKICESIFYVQVSAGSYHSCGISVDDVGAYCNKDSQCNEYGNEDEERAAACPRHIQGNLKNLPRVRYASKGIPDESADLCIPARANHIRYILPITFTLLAHPRALRTHSCGLAVVIVQN